LVNHNCPLALKTIIFIVEGAVTYNTCIERNDNILKKDIVKWEDLKRTVREQVR